MKVAGLRPKLHLFVCNHRRADDDPLGGGCRDRGEAVYADLKAAIGARGLVRSVWASKTSCLSQCPRVGCSVGVVPGPRYIVEVVPNDVDAMLDALLAP